MVRIVKPRAGALAPVVVPACAPVVAPAFAPGVCVPALAPLVVPRGRAAVPRTRRAGSRSFWCWCSGEAAGRRGSCSASASAGVVPWVRFANTKDGGRAQGRTSKDPVDPVARRRAVGSRAQGRAGLRVEVVGGLDGSEDGGREQAGGGGRGRGRRRCAAGRVGVVDGGSQEHGRQ